MRYRHTQSGARLAVMLGAGAVAVVLAAGGRAGRYGDPAVAWAALALTLGVVLACAAVFSALTVEVDAAALRWHFRLGVLRRAVPLAEIAGAEATATTLLDGIGVHVGPRGWVYNVALGPAVRVVRRDGRAFLLGTDDPAGLVAALTAPRR